MSNNDAKTEILTEVKTIVEKQKEQGVTPSWGQKQHLLLLCRLAANMGVPKESMNDFFTLLSFKGVGGNASQFRQWLESDGIAVLPKTPSAKSVLADLDAIYS